MIFFNQFTKINNLFLQANAGSVTESVIFTFFGILLFFVGIKLIINGYHGRTFWKIILGVILTGFFGIFVLLILYLIKPLPHPQKPSRKGSSPKRKPRKTTKKASS